MISGDFLQTDAALAAAGNLQSTIGLDIGPIDPARRIILCRDLARVGIGGPLVDGAKPPTYDPDPVTKAELKEFVDAGRNDLTLGRNVGKVWGALERATETAVDERATGTLQRTPVTVETALMAKLFMGRQSDGPEAHLLDLRTLREVFVGMNIANLKVRDIAPLIHFPEHYFVDWIVDITNKRYPEEKVLEPKFGR